jgi:hypothetical protein
MQRLVFIDGDKTELNLFRKIVGGVYDYTTVHWPNQSEKLFNSQPPDIFVSDLYFLPPVGTLRPQRCNGRRQKRLQRKWGKSSPGYIRIHPSTTSHAYKKR